MKEYKWQPGGKIVKGGALIKEPIPKPRRNPPGESRPTPVPPGHYLGLKPKLPKRRLRRLIRFIRRIFVKP